MRIGCWTAAALAAVILGSPWTVRAALEQPPANPNSLTGIGAVLSVQNGLPTIMELVAGGPADRDGSLKVNDRIVGVAQGNGDFVDCTTLTLDKVVAMIRGRKGTTVRLQVISAVAPLKVISLVRGEVKITGQAAAAAPTTKVEPAPLSSDEKSKLAALAKKIADAERKLMAEDMQKRVADVVQVTGLDESGSNALENAATKAIDQCVQQSAGKIDELFQTQFQQTTAEQRQQAFNQLASASDALLEANAEALQRQVETWPFDMPAWLDGLKQTLTPAQAATWDAAQASRKEAAEREIGDYLKGVASFSAQMEMQQLQPAATEVIAGLNLSGDREDKVNALAKSIAQQFSEQARAAAEKGLLAMQDDERKRILGQRSVYSWLPPVRKNAWDDGLAKLLSPDELNRLQTAKEDRKAAEAQALGKVLLALLDEKIAFTEAQRSQLEPIAQRLAKNLVDDFGQPQPGQMFNYPLSTFYGAASGASSDELKSILDPIQLRHWQEVQNMKDIQDNGNQVGLLQLPDADDLGQAQPAAEPQAVEAAISDYLADKCAAERETVFADRILKAEDVARVAHLPDAIEERLKTAALGSADTFLAGWNERVEQMVRSNIGPVSPETVKQRLDSIPDYQFDQMRQQIGDTGSVLTAWDAALKTDLSPDQLAAWKQETAARRDYRERAIAGMIAWVFAQQVGGLTQDQTAKLEPMITKVVVEYGADIDRFFQSNSPWYLQSPYTLVPVVAIPDKDLSALLSKEQMDRWTGSNECSNGHSWWSGIVQNHNAANGGRN
jgi:hypothetical protein